MNLYTVIILVLIGLFVGFFSGFYGLGGGILLIPALVYLLEVNQQTAQGTSIAIMLLPLGLFAFLNYYKSGHVNLPFAVIIAITFMLGSYFGSKISLSLPEILMKRIFAGVLIIVAVKILAAK